MMIFSLVAMIGLEKCCITSACLQWLCHSGERTVARGPLVIKPVHFLFQRVRQASKRQWGKLFLMMRQIMRNLSLEKLNVNSLVDNRLY